VSRLRESRRRFIDGKPGAGNLAKPGYQSVASVGDSGPGLKDVVDCGQRI